MPIRTYHDLKVFQESYSAALDVSKWSQNAASRTGRAGSTAKKSGPISTSEHRGRMG